jgi:hypothetical protein
MVLIPNRTATKNKNVTVRIVVAIVAKITRRENKQTLLQMEKSITLGNILFIF